MLAATANTLSSFVIWSTFNTSALTAASFSGLASYPVACTSGTGSVEDAIEQTATGVSGL